MDNILQCLTDKVLEVCTHKIRSLKTEQNKMKICKSIDEMDLLYMTNLKSRINFLTVIFNILTNRSKDIDRFLKLDKVITKQAKLLNISRFHYKKHLTFCTQIKKIILNHLNLEKEKLT